MRFNVSCKVKVSGEDISVNSLEKAALDVAREAGRRLLKSLLGLVERQVREGKQRQMGSRLELLSSSSLDLTFQAKIAELWGYIERNKEGIKNAARLIFTGLGR